MPQNIVDIVAVSMETACPDATDWLPQEVDEDDAVDNIIDVLFDDEWDSDSH